MSVLSATPTNSSLFLSLVEAVGSEVVYSLTDKEDLPFINHPVVQAVQTWAVLIAIKHLRAVD